MQDLQRSNNFPQILLFQWLIGCVSIFLLDLFNLFSTNWGSYAIVVHCNAESANIWLIVFLHWHSTRQATCLIEIIVYRVNHSALADKLIIQEMIWVDAQTVMHKLVTYVVLVLYHHSIHQS